MGFAKTNQLIESRIQAIQGIISTGDNRRQPSCVPIRPKRTFS